MGNCLTEQPPAEARANQYNNNLGLGLKPIPYHSFSMNTRTDAEGTDVKRPVDYEVSPNSSRLEVETLKLSSNNTSRASSFNNHSNRSSRYIKRYRNEEEKLMDIIKEREGLIRSAIKQGQELRAKCNRYKEELDSLKAMTDIDMTDVEWKKKYNELDKRNRDLKEELDVLSARNNNGRDQMQHQSHVIEQLNSELQRERIEKQRLLSNSLNSLRSVGVKDKKGKLMITQLEVDNRLLQERLNDLTVRNQRGREYLAKLESEKREQDEILAKLKAQLLKEKEEKENLKAKVNILSSQHNLYNEETKEEPALYAQVQKKKTESSDKPYQYKAQNPVRPNSYEAVNYHGESSETKSMGFDVDREDSRHVRSEVYEEVMFIEEVPRDDDDKEHDKHNKTEEPYMTTYGYQSAGPGSPGSTPRIVEDIVINDPEPVWEHIPQSNEVDMSNDITTRF